MKDPTTPNTQQLGRTMMFLAWIIVLALFAYFFHFWDQKQSRPQQAILSTKNGITETVIKRNADNQYRTEGKINGKSVTLLLDTGANHVVIPASLAKELGLERGPEGIATTAGGDVRIYLTKIDEIEVGHITLHRVTAMINPEMPGHDVLLGMSALKRIHFTQRDDELVLTAPEIKKND